MKRTLKVLLGVVALALIGVSTASAQTGALLGKDLYLFDGGSGTAQNYVQLVTPGSSLMTTNWTLTLPPDGGGIDYILVNTDGNGTTEWQDGLSLFWGIEGNCDAITAWDPNTQTGNYIGHCLNDLDFRSGDDFMNFWFNTMLFPVFTLNENGTMTLQTGDGYEGLVIGGQPGGITGPDAAIVIDCALPPTVGIEVNALSTGILMPTACAPGAPLTGIDLQAQTLGLHTEAPTALWAEGTTQLDGDVDINLGVGEFVNISGTTADATATEILLLDASDNLVTRTIGAGSAIVTGSGTQYTLPLWVDAAGTEIGNSILTQDAGATTATVGGGLTVSGATTLQGTVTVDPADIALDAADTRILSIDGVSGLVGYRTIPANGDIVVSNGPLTNNGAVYTNNTGQLEAVALTNGQVLIGSTGNPPVAATLTEGVGIDITNAAGSITISSEIADGTAANNTLRWDGTNWVENGNLQSDGFGNTNINGGLTVGDNAADVLDINASTIDITNVPTTTEFANVLVRDGVTGDIEVSTQTFAVTAGGTLAANRNVRTDGSGNLTVGAIDLAGGSNEVTGVLPIANGGTNSSTALNNNRIMVSSGGAIVEAAALTNGQLLIGSTGAAPVAASITAGTGISVTPGPGSITIANTNPTIPAPGVGNTNWTLRSDGSAWVASGALQNDGANVSMTGNLDVDGNTTLGTTDANTHTIIGVTNVNTSGNASTTIGHVASTGSVNVLTNTGGITLNTQAGNLNLTAGGTFALQSATGGSINTTNNVATTIGTNNVASSVVINSPTIDIDNVPTSASSTNLLRRNVSGEIEVSTAIFPTAPVALTANTALRTNASGQIESVALTNGQLLIGSTGAAPVAAAPISTDGSITITTGAGSLDLEVTNPLPGGVADQTLRYDGGTNAWVATSNLSNDGTDVQATGSLFVGGNTTFGDADGDNHSFQGDLDVNIGVATQAKNVNINTGDNGAFTQTTTLGGNFANNTVNLNSPSVNAPNLPATGAQGDQVVVSNAGNLRTATVETIIGGTPWLRGGNTGALSGTLGTTDAVDVDLTANNVQHINLNTGDQSTEINTTATGDVTIGANTVNSTIINSDDVRMPNLPNDPSASTWVVTYNNTTGALEKKDLGTPVQKTKTFQATITGTGATAVFNIVDAFVAANSIILVTLQDGGGNPDNNNYTVAIQAVAAGNFDIRLSGIVANTETKLVNYTVVNP